MLKRLLPALCLTLPLYAAAQTEPAAPEAEAAPETILLVGQRPGPGLWKVSKGDHVLWVFGSYSPLPDKMEWRSQQVESILAQSQEYLAPPGVYFHLGFWRGLTVLPRLVGVTKNPDGATLRDVLPADIYARWEPLKARYLGKDSGIERERPIFAAQTLYEAGLKQAGLSRGGGVGARIDAIVKERKIRRTPTVLKLELDNASQVVSDFKKSSLADTACFEKTLARLETDLDAMRVRANAWAKGDLDVIRKLSFPDQQSECDNAMLNADVVRDRQELHNLKERTRETWVNAAEAAIGRNTTSFAMLSLSQILAPDGYLAALQAKGYQVDSPE